MPSKTAAQTPGGGKSPHPPSKSQSSAQPSGNGSSGIAVSFGNLGNSVVGQESDNNGHTLITLDRSAGGYGWFIDPNPADNSANFLPTSNPDVWIAKPDSAAAGKMDLLSVLLHEYGHALGLDHSPDSNDFMGAVLQPGERRLPSQAELALMTKLVAQLKGDSAAPNTPVPGTPNPLPLGGGALALVLAGRLRRTGYGASTMAVQSARLEPQALTAVNPALTNGTFNSSTGWSTSGTVQVAAGTATLSDNTSAQSRLSQAFVLGANDRFLRFTLSNVALQNPGDRPEDAFEVSLLNAGSGVSVSTPIGLSHTDALLNLQGDGHMFLGQNVSFITNADGSRTYIVDLRNVPTGTAVNLSFDLISFDPSASHVTISDLATFAVPHANDAAFNGLESGAVATTLTGNVLTNDGNVYGATPVIVQGPAHGKLTLNPDGSFVYTPDYLFYGNDSFSYALSNGGIQSNTAAVSLSVKYVNQPPVAKDATLNLLENGSVSLDLHTLTSDVDGDPLTFRIAHVTVAPLHIRSNRLLD